jgi:XRE family transcriptional regulator, aerobic/anaerobic benzoate catabolism transcriptional regulator
MAKPSPPRRPKHKDAAFLQGLAGRIRDARAQRGMTRTALAADSGVSLRFLAQLEAGEGNPSLLVLRRVADAMGFPLELLLTDEPTRSPDQVLVTQIVARLSPAELRSARELLTERFCGHGPAAGTGSYVALIGLRGAGKSTLGRRLALHRGVPFFELDREVEREYGATIGEILQLHGQPGYRRFERQCLLNVLDQHPAAVIETGGGLAADPETLPLLLESCQVVWVRATPEEHMQRVIDQGDMRPMAKSREAMRELKNILKAREPYYKQAALQLITSGKSVDVTFAELLGALARESGTEAS